MNRIIAFILYAFFINVLSLMSQDLDQFRFRNISTQEGLSSSNIHQIIQDHNGFIWMATENGLCQYNGTSFKTYSSIDFGNQVSSNVTSLLQVDSSTIWLVIDKQTLVEYDFDCHCFSLLDERFDHMISKNGKGIFKLKIIDHKIYLIGDVCFVFENKHVLENILLFPSATSDLCKIDQETWLTIGFDHSIYQLDTLKNNKDKIKKKLKRIKKIADNWPANVVIEDNIGTFWSAPWENSVYQINPDSSSPIIKYPLVKNSSDKDIEVNTLLKDNKDRLWIGTNNSGLQCLFDREKRPYHFGVENNIPSDLFVNNIFEDDASRLWISTKHNGVFVYDPKTNRSEGYKLFDKEKHTDINAIFELSKNSYLIGTNNGLWVWDAKDKIIKVESLNHNDLNIHSIYKNRDEEILLGTNKALLKYDISKRKIIPFYTIPLTDKDHSLNLNILENTRILDLVDYILPSKENAEMDDCGNRYLEKKHIISNEFCTYTPQKRSDLFRNNSGNNFLFGVCYGYGIFYIDYKNKLQGHSEISKKHGVNEQLIETNRLNKIYVDNDNSLWFLTEFNGAWLSKGLLIDSFFEKKFSDPAIFDYLPALGEEYSHKTLLGDHYSSDNFVDMIQLDSLHYLITTINGELLKINFKSKIIFNLLDLNQKILGIISLENNEVMVAMEQGVCKYNIDSNKVSFFKKEDGIQYVGKSYLLDSKGDLLMGGKNGISIIKQINTIKARNENHSIYLKGLQVMGKSYPDSLLEDHLILDYDQNFLQFHLASLSLTPENATQYLYRLRGLHQNWISTADLITYNDLGSGKYGLEVCIDNGYGIKSSPIIISKIKINAPFWKTWWFGFFVFGLVIVILYSLYKRRIERERKLASLKLDTEIAAQESERKRLAEELHDDFGVRISALKMYVNTIERLAGDKEEKLKSLSGTAVKLVDDSMSDLRNLLTNLSPNTLRVYGLNAALDELICRINGIGKFEILFHSDYIRSSLSEHKELNIFRVIQELINNAIKHSNCTVIDINIKQEKKMLFLNYVDNGQGFEKNDNNLGYGLKNIENRVASCEGEISWDNGLQGVKFNCIIPLIK